MNNFQHLKELLDNSLGKSCLKGFCQLESMHPEVMQILLFLMCDFLSCSRLRNLQKRRKRMGLDKGYFVRTYGTFLLWLC